MNDEFVAVAMMLTTFAALGATLGRLRARAPTMMSQATQLALGIAVADARTGGQSMVTLTHVAIGLLADPAIAGELEDRGISILSLYEELLSLLPPSAGPAVPKTARAELPTFDVEVQSLLRRVHDERYRPAPVHLLEALLAKGPEPLREAFRHHALTTATRRAPPARASETRLAAQEAPPSGPYRAPPRTEDVSVILWNDDRTTMEFVVELLRGTFGIVPPRAVWLMLQVHREGFATIGRFERRSAEQLVTLATSLAREKRFPLNITIEVETPRPSLLERLFGTSRGR